MTGSVPVAVSQSELDRRVIRPDQFVADPRAFVDVRLPQSKGKASYSFIGPGVSQNALQVVNLSETHGFNVGAASLPAGAVNNPHLHFTAEVFICTRGSFRFVVGLGEDAARIDVGVGDVLSVPTWVFRSFENTGTEEGWTYTILGNDITGGIIWAPDVLVEAAETGLYLDASGRLIDTVDGGSIEGVELLPPMADEDISALPHFTPEELMQRLVSADQRSWQQGTLLSGCLGGHRVETAGLIGHGFTEAPNIAPPIPGHHSFTASWLRAEPGNQTGGHTVAECQVAYLISGEWEIECNEKHETARSSPPAGSVVSLPAGSLRNLRVVGATPATLILVTAGDARPTISWSQEVMSSAASKNVALDTNGCVGPAHLIQHGAGLRKR